MASVLVQEGPAFNLADTVRCTIYTWLEDQYGLTSICFQRNGGDFAGSIGRFGQLLWDGVILGQLQPMLASPVKMLGIRVVKVQPTNFDVAGVVQDDSTGGSGDTPLPKQTCGLIDYRTAFRGPSGRGRMFLPFPSTDDNDAALAVPNAAYIANGVALKNALVTTQNLADGFTNVTAIPVLFNLPALRSRPLLSKVFDSEWATQRRRSSFGRQNPQTIPL